MSECYLVESDNKYHFVTTSLKQLFLQMLFNYLFVNQDDHARNFSFMCSDDYKWRVTPAYDITFSKGMKQTREHQTTLNAKVLSQVNLQDIVNIATEFSINLEFVSSAIETMNSLKNTKLASLINKYEISLAKQEQVLQEVMKRDFQGELNE